MHCFREDFSKRQSNRSEVFKKKEREKGKIHKAEPARMERGIMKPSKLLQSHRAFFLFLFFFCNSLLILMPNSAGMHSVLSLYIYILRIASQHCTCKESKPDFKHLESAKT